MISAPDDVRVVALKPAQRIRSTDLPSEILQSLSALQRDGLAFATRRMKVTSARVQTFQTGSKSKGKVNLVGADRALGQYWGVFGATGSINQHSINEFRTDIQIKLEDASGEKVFLNYSLPFAITLALDPGETLQIFFVKGGLAKRFAQGDYRCDNWVAFAARNVETGQFLPIGFLPSLVGPRAKWLTVGIIVGVIGLMFLSASKENFGIGLFVLSAIFIIVYVSEKQQYSKDFRKSKDEAASALI